DRARVSGSIRAPALTPQAPPVGAESATDIAGTWTRYQELVAAGVGPASLEELLAGGAGREAPGRGRSVSPDSEVSRAKANGGEPVDIRSLLYKGSRARARAQELREAAKRANGDALRAIIDEVCDLVVLAIEP